MKNILILISNLLLISFNSIAYQGQSNEKQTNSNHDLSMYPKANDSLNRYVISLVKMDNENDLKVEIYVGKTMEVDCNTYLLSGSFIENTITGFGYTYFDFDSNSQIISTKMACPEESKHDEFVKSSSQLINYNSRLPIVIYTNREYKVKYRMWNRDMEEYEASEK